LIGISDNFRNRRYWLRRIARNLFESFSIIKIRRLCGYRWRLLNFMTLSILHL